MGCVHSKKKVHAGSEEAVSGHWGKSFHKKRNSETNINNNNVANGKIANNSGSYMSSTPISDSTQTNGNNKKFLSRQTSVFQV